MGHPSLSIPSHTHVPGPHKSIYRSWANNCEATNTTNGVDYYDSDTAADPRLVRAALLDTTEKKLAVGLPDPYLPSLESVKGSAGSIKSYILPGNNTGVVRVLRVCSGLSMMSY
jgi:hypothetical protein